MVLPQWTISYFEVFKSLTKPYLNAHVQFCSVVGLAMDIFFTPFNIYFGNQYDDVPTGEVWRVYVKKQNKHSGNHPTFNRPAMCQIYTFPSLHFLGVVSFAVVMSCCCCLFGTGSHYAALAGQKLTVMNLPYTSWVLGVKACATMPGRTVYLCVCFSGSFCRAQAVFLPHSTECELCSLFLPYLASRTVHPKCPYVINKLW